MPDLDPGLGEAGDTYSETQHVGFLDKLGQSLVGLLLGPLFIAGSCFGLFWNEGRAVTTARSLTEGASLVQSVDVQRVDPANEGRLVHVAGPFSTGAPLVDPEFQVTAKGALLARVVEMYQWQEESHTETRKNIGGSEDRTTVYTYKKAWSSRPVDSSRFKQAASHTNPEMLYRAHTEAAKDGALGAFRPGAATLRRLAATERLAVEPALAERLRPRVAGGRVHIVDGRIHIGADPARPEVGDMRISFNIARPEVISIVGRQSGTDLVEYQTKAGDRLLFARAGNVPAADIFTAAQQDNKVLTWIIRLIAVIFMLVGFMLLSGPLVALGDVIPFVGSLIGVVGALAAVIMTAIVAPLVIAVAWLWYRPLVSIAVVAAGLVIAALARFVSPARRPVPVPARPQPSFLPRR